MINIYSSTLQSSSASTAALGAGAIAAADNKAML
jgi:hypothetical protein